MNLPPNDQEDAFLKLQKGYKEYKNFVGRSWLRWSIRNTEFTLEAYKSFSKQDEVAKDVAELTTKLISLKQLYYQETGEAYDRTKED